VLVTLNLTGAASTVTVSDLNFQVLAEFSTVFTGAVLTNILLCSTCRIDPSLTPPLNRFSVFIRTLVPAALLPDDVDLDFTVQFKFITTSTGNPPGITLDPAPDVLVAEEIGALTL
jgi:hypothetical protein